MLKTGCEISSILGGEELYQDRLWHKLFLHTLTPHSLCDEFILVVSETAWLSWDHSLKLMEEWDSETCMALISH